MSNNNQKNSREISQPVKNFIWQRSAGRCAYPDCRTLCVKPGTKKDGPVTIGQIAHIHAHSKNGPRPNPKGFTDETNGYDNLILLCSNHHREVDIQTNTHTVADLQKWKIKLERWIAYRLSEEEFDTADLELITNWLADNSTLPSDNYTLLPPPDKMKKNDMSASTIQLVRMGLMRVGEVQIYIKDSTKLHPNLAERLLNPLLKQYNILRVDGLNSDMIFENLRDFACGKSLDFRKQAAGLAIIVYFFERCEIFEK